MIGGMLSRLLGRDQPLTHDQAKELARNQDVAVRTRLAARGDLRPELLYFLAEDESPDVRRQVANNGSTPPLANRLLAGDKDEAVRADLARKISTLAPGLTHDEHDKVRRITYDTLEMLARDQIPMVRKIVAEALKDVADAPPAVIGRLARDAEIAVAYPVLAYSPVLTDEDLLDIIGHSPISGALSAISRRTGVGSAVSDAIASSDDLDAIAILLGNPSAQIREETLDRLVDRAIDVDIWHQPLVQRPHLSSKSVLKLARFVAGSMLKSLAERQDLDPETAHAVAAQVEKRLAEMDDTPPESNRAAAEEMAVDRARAMKERGELTETVVDTALAGGDQAFVVAALAVLADVSLDLVRSAVRTQSAKGMVALAWKSELSASLAAELQSRLLHLPPDRVLRPRAGSYPLSPADMAWQLEFLGGN